MGGDIKIRRVRYYELSPSACVQNFWSIGHSRDLELFFGNLVGPGKAINNGIPWEVYKPMVANSSKSLTSQVAVTFNANKHLYELDSHLKTLITGADVAELVKFQNCNN